MASYYKLPRNSRFQRVGVLGGKTIGKKECYKITTIELGEELVSKGLDVVCNCEIIRLLALLSQVVRSAGGHISTHSEHGNAISELQQRKEEVARLSDCFIILPGDLGAMEEFMEIVSWAQLGIHDKPIGLLNIGGFFDPFIAQIDTAIEEGFIKPSQKKIIIVSSSAKDLLRKMEAYKPTREGAIPKDLWEAEAGSSNLDNI